MLEATATVTTETTPVKAVVPEKLCSKCGNPGEFRKGRSECRACGRASKNAHHRQHPQQALELNRRRRSERQGKLARLKANPCTDCGKSFPYYVMDFDHRDPSTKFLDVSRMVARSFAWETILVEVAKCDLVCVRCHRMRTWRPSKKKLDKRQRLIVALKNVPCADCGQAFHYCQMDFDHVRGKKSACVTTMTSTEAVRTEAAKCDVVCANCHRVRTHIRPHGTYRLEPSDIQPRRVPRPRPTQVRPWHALVGTMSDVDVAVRACVTRSVVTVRRQRMGIPSFRKSNQMAMESNVNG